MACFCRMSNGVIDWRSAILSMRITVLALVAGLTFAAASARAAPVDTGHIQADLVARTAAAAPGSTFHVALTQRLDQGWHSYWRNPGDAGAPPRIRWILPQGWSAGSIVWATPRRLPLKTLMDYGYTGEVVLPIPINVPASARPGQTVVLEAEVAFLVCQTLCVPERAVLSLPVRVQTGSPLPAPRTGALIDRALAAAPKSAGLTSSFARKGGVVTLTVDGPLLKGARADAAYFYPYASTVIEHAAPQRVERRGDRIVFSLAAGEDFRRGAAPTSLGGVIVLGGAAYEVTARPRPAGRAGR